MGSNSIYSRIFLWLIFYLAAAFVVLCHFYLKPIGVDAGLHMYGSLLLSKGLLPYENLWNNKPPLIYLLGDLGFLFTPNPFIGVRLLEIISFIFNLIVLNKILRFSRVELAYRLVYLISFVVIYLACWDGGFLTETFSIPVNLLIVYLYLKKTRYFIAFASLAWIICFLMKQNAMFVVTGVILIDIFTNYRKGKTLQKIFLYFLWLCLFCSVVMISLKGLGIWNDYIDQVFIYNAEYANRPSLYQAITGHLVRNSFISIKGVSFLILLNVCMLFTLWKCWKNYKSEEMDLKDKLLVSSILIYFGSYLFVYMSGRTDAHYFMLLIVPATIVVGYYVTKTSIGKCAIVALIVYVVLSNMKAIRYYKNVYADMEAAAGYMKSNSNSNDFILIAGFGNQYLHVVSNRLSPTRFVMPLLENNGYNAAYRKIILNDLSVHPPMFIILNKNNYRGLNVGDFYTQVIEEKLKHSILVFENNSYQVYRKDEHLIGSAR